MRAFPGTKRFKIIGFPRNNQIKLTPLQLSAEGILEIVERMSDTEDEKQKKRRLMERIFPSSEWTDGEIKKVNNVLGIGGNFRISINEFCETAPTIIRRNALGEERWFSRNHLPVCWQIKPHPPLHE